MKNRCAYKLLEEKEEDGLYIFKPPAQGHFQIAADSVRQRLEIIAGLMFVGAAINLAKQIQKN